MGRKEITTKEDLMKVIELFENTGITYWLDGGWGVDILAGKQTRIHRDIDINFDAQHTEKLLNVLLNLCSGIISQQIFKRLKISTSPT